MRLKFTFLWNFRETLINKLEKLLITRGKAIINDEMVDQKPENRTFLKN